MEINRTQLKTYLQEVIQPVVIILIGLPLSGKDTLIDCLDLKNFKILSRDGIIETQLPESTYREAYSAMDSKTIDKLFFKELEEGVNNQESLLINATNLRVKRRRKIILRIPAEYLKVAIQMPEITLEEYEIRNQNRREQTGKHIPPKVFEEMKALYEEVTEEEGFDQIFILNQP